MNGNSSLTTTSILAMVSKFLLEGGYQQVDDSLRDIWQSTNVRLFEDTYGIVALAVFETWNDLSSNWKTVQASLVEIISEYVPRNDSKAWDGYLVLITSNRAPSKSEINKIRYDTKYVRKFVSTGDDLKRQSDVENLLLPLLPILEEDVINKGGSLLDALPEILSHKGIEKDAVRILIQAYHNQLPLVESLYEYRRTK